jgi:hypothetical protein
MAEGDVSDARAAPHGRGHTPPAVPASCVPRLVRGLGCLATLSLELLVLGRQLLSVPVSDEANECVRPQQTAKGKS